MSLEKRVADRFITTIFNKIVNEQKLDFSQEFREKKKEVSQLCQKLAEKLSPEHAQELNSFDDEYWSLITIVERDVYLTAFKDGIAFTLGITPRFTKVQNEVNTR